MAKENAFEPVFDYKAQLQQFRLQLWQRLAAYVEQNPRIRLTEIARAFNINVHTVQFAMAKNGVKRVQGCKTWHYPPKAQ
jgi:hypothetical protein